MCGDFLNFFHFFLILEHFVLPFLWKKMSNEIFISFPLKRTSGMSEYVLLLLLVSSSSKDGLLILSFLCFLFFFLHLLKGIYEFLTWRNQEEKTNYSFGRKTSCAKKSGVKDKSHRRLYIPSFVIVNFKKLLQNRSFIIEYKQ